MNRAGLTFSLKINHLADFTDYELHRLRGRLPAGGYNGGSPFPEEEFSDDIPENLDWRLMGNYYISIALIVLIFKKTCTFER